MGMMILIIRGVGAPFARAARRSEGVARGSCAGLRWSRNMTNMARYNIAEAKARFSELVERALAGD
jgi:hypothetical protein